MCDPQNPRPYWDTLWELLMVYCPTVRQMTEAMVLAAMARSDGNQRQAAETLGWNQRNMRHTGVRAMQDRWAMHIAQEIKDEERQVQHIRDRKLKRMKAYQERLAQRVSA